jgi:hypothetical protein
MIDASYYHPHPMGGGVTTTMIDVDYLREPLDWHDKLCGSCDRDLEQLGGNIPDPVVVHVSNPARKVSVLLCGDCRYKLARLLS